MVSTYALLCLQLNSNELFTHVLHVADSCERHLLLDVMTEPAASDDIAEYVWNYIAKEQSAIDHWLKGEPLAEGKGHAPIGIDIAQARLPVKTQEIICYVGILSF